MSLRDPEARRAYHTAYMRNRYSKREDVRKKQIVRVCAGKAIRRGAIKRRPCEKCGRVDRIEAHHSDYSKPLEVQFLCVSCHKQEHYNAGGPETN